MLFCYVTVREREREREREAQCGSIFVYPDHKSIKSERQVGPVSTRKKQQADIILHHPGE